MTERVLRVADADGPAEAGGPVLSNGVLGMSVFVLSEIMLFAGMISAFSIMRASAVEWPPPGQPRLPVGTTLFNTAALLSSGAALIVASRHFYRGDRQNARSWMRPAIGLGLFFVAFQGYEWVMLIREGLTITSSAHGSFFYLIVGAHALHAVAALIGLGVVWQHLERGSLTGSMFGAGLVFWLFVVGLWPILYWRVYL